MLMDRERNRLDPEPRFTLATMALGKTPSPKGRTRGSSHFGSDNRGPLRRHEVSLGTRPLVRTSSPIPADLDR